MGTTIQILWLIQNTGVPIFRYPPADDGTADSLFGGMLTALLQLTKQSTDFFIKDIATKQYLFFITPIEQMNLFLAARADRKVKVKRAEREVEQVVNLFTELYKPEDLEKWNGNMNFFNPFGAVLEDILGN